ncbi:hypothetical protein PVAP13_1NG318419, partial [Panicum virgatum]
VKKIVLLPPAEIVKHDKALAEISKNDNALDPPAETKLKGSALHHAIPCFADMFCFHMFLLLCLAKCALLFLTFL